MRLFPKNYEDAVIKFRGATADLSAESGIWKVSEGLEVDHRYWPALKERQTLFILMSGVHGPETYAGHGIQMLFLRDIWPKLKRDRCGVFLVHSLNPYGFKHNRRGTEAGVNLNRNCSIFPDLYSIENQASLAMGRRFVPAKPLASFESLLLQSMKREGEKICFGSPEVSLDQYIRAVAPGQFVTAEGLEFGGKAPEPQIRALIARLKEILPGYRDVVFFDLHTGLGHRGRLHLLVGDKKGCIDLSLFNEILDPKADADAYEYTPNDEQGFYPTFGSTNDMMAELVPQRLCALTMEFGTYGHDLEAQLKGLNIWMAEHQGGCYGYATPELERQVRAEHLEKFFPSSEVWGESVLTASHQVFSRVLQRLGHVNC